MSPLFFVQVANPFFPARARNPFLLSFLSESCDLEVIVFFLEYFMPASLYIMKNIFFFSL